MYSRDDNLFMIQPSIPTVLYIKPGTVSKRSIPQSHGAGRGRNVDMCFILLDGR